jgi:hypothetical protein
LKGVAVMLFSDIRVGLTLKSPEGAVIEVVNVTSNWVTFSYIAPGKTHMETSFYPYDDKVGFKKMIDEGDYEII